ncbi:hypothetical protein [Streptomyces sp. NPDC055642]
MTRRKAWGLAAAAFVAGGAPAFTVAVQGDGTPGVTVGEAQPGASQMPETRARPVAGPSDAPGTADAPTGPTGAGSASRPAPVLRPAVLVAGLWRA